MTTYTIICDADRRTEAAGYEDLSTTLDVVTELNDMHGHSHLIRVETDGMERQKQEAARWASGLSDTRLGFELEAYVGTVARTVLEHDALMDEAGRRLRIYAKAEGCPQCPHCNDPQPGDNQ